MSYETEHLQRILEGALLAAGEPLSLERMQSLFEEQDMPDKEALQQALNSLQSRCEDRGFELVEVASGYRLQVRQELAVWINRLWEEKPPKYSRAMLETLALIAYRQPITRGDIEEVRGVAVSSHIIKTLVEREWVKVVGHRDVPGRPSLYATTKQFLDYFNLKSLDELPTLGELRDIDSLNESLVFDDLPPEIQESLVGSADDEEGSIEEGATKEVSTAEDSTEEDSTEEDSTEEGSTEEGSTEEGSTEEGSTEEGSTEEGSTEEVSTAEASTEEDKTAKDNLDSGEGEFVDDTETAESGIDEDRERALSDPENTAEDMSDTESEHSAEGETTERT